MNKEEVRKPITVSFNGIEKIISYNIIKEVEQGVSEFQFTSENDSAFNLEWKYFDPNYGINVQIIYLGDENIKSHLNGNIFETELKEFIPIQNARKRNSSLYTLIVLLMAGGVTIMIILSIYRFFKRGFPKKVFSFDFFMGIVYPILLMIMVGYSIFIFYFKIQEIPF